MNNSFLKDKAVIFDLDGVLVDSANCHYIAWKTLADRLDIKFDENKNHLLRGVSRRKSLQIMIDGQLTLDENEFEQLMKEKNSIYQKLIAEAGKKLLLPCVPDFLKELRRTPLKTAIASGSKNASKLLDIVGLDRKLFDAIITGKDFIRTKPDPESFLLAAKKLSVNPKHCLVLEDAPAGIKAAKSAGMGAYGVGKADLKNCDIRDDSINEKSLDKVIAYFKSLRV